MGEKTDHRAASSGFFHFASRQTWLTDEPIN